jgi:fructose-1,6-bisphosphatase/inositol monophosphatase family enzyme
VSPQDNLTRSLLVTGFGYEHDEAWVANMELFKRFTDVTQGVRRLGAAAVDLCHVSMGLVDAYWEYRCAIAGRRVLAGIAGRLPSYNFRMALPIDSPRHVQVWQ